MGLPSLTPTLDTYREVVTPEGVALHLPAAGPVPRALAWAIDFALRGKTPPPFEISLAS